jgi:uncharacterized protein (DUF2141 family)
MNASAQTLANLDVSVSGLRSTKGNVLICLTANPKTFPDCGKDPKAVRLIIPSVKAHAIRFTGIAPGTYALSLHHDENGNNKMDMALFLPKEGFGFSRNPKIGMGPPKFAQAAFVVGAADAKMTVAMKYML